MGASLTDACYADSLGVEDSHALELSHEHVPALEGLLQSCPPLLRHPALLQRIHGLQDICACFLLLREHNSISMSVSASSAEAQSCLLNATHPKLHMHVAHNEHVQGNTREGGERFSSKAALSRF